MWDDVAPWRISSTSRICAVLPIPSPLIIEAPRGPYVGYARPSHVGCLSHLRTPMPAPTRMAIKGDRSSSAFPKPHSKLLLIIIPRLSRPILPPAVLAKSQLCPTISTFLKPLHPRKQSLSLSQSASFLQNSMINSSQNSRDIGSKTRVSKALLFIA